MLSRLLLSAIAIVPFFLSSVAALSDASFVLVGDSTTNNGTTLKSGGWGNGFCSSLEAGTWCSIRAANGRSTGTIVSDGYWELALEDVRNETAKGKSVFTTIQFGHNDASKSGLPPSSMGANLTSFVHQLRAIAPSVVPVLVTPLARRWFLNGTETIYDDLADWAAETRAVAHNTSTPLVDLHAASIAYLEAIGRDASWLINKADFTHLNDAGVVLFGRMMADLVQLFALNYPGVPKIRSPFVVDSALSLAIYNGEQVVFGNRTYPYANYTGSGM